MKRDLIESGPWTETDLLDLRRAIESGKSAGSISEYLSRPKEEILQKAKELGLPLD